MDTIKFANGAVYNCSFLSTVPFGNTMQAIIALADISFAEAASIFSNPDMVSVMEYGEYQLVDYTTLQGVYNQSYGIQAVLTGGHNERRNETTD